MNLIAYSDSEDSGSEVAPPTKPAAKPAPKPAFSKVVDRSNPGRIKLNIPGVSQPQAEKDDIEAEAPPAKRARIGGGAFSGFNAMLPAPKKPKVDAATGGITAGKRGVGKGLGAGINLKTGAEPAFKRELRVEEEDYDENGNPIKKEPLKKEDFRALLNLPPPKSERAQNHSRSVAAETVPNDPKTEGKSVAKPKFMPMSVARGKKKKKPIIAKPTVPALEGSKLAAAPVPASGTVEAKPAAKPKVSLFSISQETEATAKDKSNGNYQPLLIGTEEDEEDAPWPDETYDAQSSHQRSTTSAAVPYAPAASSDLTNIASELNLSEAERRQLFGRKGHGPDFSSARIVEFNTDNEYAHNEKLRQQGETIQHNALKSITGTGKNSLRSLVNVATTQKDALEEHFAQGRRNKKEAGNKYGW